MTKTYYLIEHTNNFEWKLAGTIDNEETTDWYLLGRKFAKQMNLDPSIVNHYGEFADNGNGYRVVDEWDYQHDYAKKVANND